MKKIRSTILAEIIEEKKKEVEELHGRYDLVELLGGASFSAKDIVGMFSHARVHDEKVFIAEFKRQSPSEKNINTEVSIEDQVRKYVASGAHGISILTDKKFFGGSYDDLARASEVVRDQDVFLLQKDFIIDPIQIALARTLGADAVLLIASILERNELLSLSTCARRLGMQTICEVHTLEEYHEVKSLGFKIIGVNNRDLNTFSVHLNIANVIAHEISNGIYIIAESGIESSLDARVAGVHADGFLIGTSLMRNGLSLPLTEHFEIGRKYFFKACGLRNLSLINAHTADLVGVNFSPHSKRRIDPSSIYNIALPPNAVAVFKGNSLGEITAILEKLPFRYVQVYDDVPVDFVRSLRKKIILAISVKDEFSLSQAEEFAPYVDFFILDGHEPGSGKAIDQEFIRDFPYPFLLAGGMNVSTIDSIVDLPNCIGVDIASGIETDGEEDEKLIRELRLKINDSITV